MSRLISQSACMKHLQRPKIDNCGMSKPTATVFDAGQGWSRHGGRILIRQKDSVCCYKVAVCCCDPGNGRKRDRPWARTG